jgi:hypothetical protein
MNPLVNIISYYIFLILLFWLRFPNLNTDDYLYHKIVLVFMSVSFQIVFRVIEKIRKKCLIDSNKLMIEGLNYGMMALIGYSIYQDLMTMSATRTYLIVYGSNPLIIALIITLFVSTIEILKLMTKTNIEKCLTINNSKISNKTESIDN